MIDNNKIVSRLREVKDPINGQDIIQTQRVSELRIQEHNVAFTLDVTGFDSETKMRVNQACEQAIKSAFPDAVVHLHMKAKDAHQAPKAGIPQIKNIIAVASGKGGVGKSTVAVNLALALQREGHRVGLIDADLYGPSIPTMLGLQGQRPKIETVYGKHKIIPLEAYGIHVMSIGFVVDAEQAVVLRGPRLSGVIKQFVNDCIWPELDYMIIDLPPGTGDIQLTLVQTVPLTGAIMVTTPQQVAVVDAVKAMNMFLLDNIKVPILGVVENMSWFTPKELPDNKYFLFGEGGGKQLVERSESTFLGQVPLIQAVREGGDAGQPVSVGEDIDHQMIFKKIAKNVEMQVKLRNEQLAPTQVVQVK